MGEEEVKQLIRQIIKEELSIEITKHNHSDTYHKLTVLIGDEVVCIEYID